MIDTIPGAKVELRVPERVKNVRTVPGGETLPFVREADTVKVDVPTFTMHTAVVFEY